MDEREVTELFKNYLVRTSERQGTELWYEKHYIPRFPTPKGLGACGLVATFELTQPEVDLIYGPKREGDRRPPIYAVELKYIRVRGGQVTHSYYAGVDEALAILALGVDYSLLVHIVDAELLKTYFIYYIALASRLVRSLRIPIGYQVYALHSAGREPVGYEISKYVGGCDLSELYVEPAHNPLLTHSEGGVREWVMENRKALAKRLDVRLTPEEQ